MPKQTLERARAYDSQELDASFWHTPEAMVTALLLSITATLANTMNALPFLKAIVGMVQGWAAVGSLNAFQALLGAVSAAAAILAISALLLAFSKRRMRKSVAIGFYALVSAFVLSAWI